MKVNKGLVDQGTQQTVDEMREHQVDVGPSGADMVDKGHVEEFLEKQGNESNSVLSKSLEDLNSLELAQDGDEDLNKVHEKEIVRGRGMRSFEIRVRRVEGLQSEKVVSGVHDNPIVSMKEIDKRTYSIAVIEFTTLTVITYLFKFMAESVRGDTAKSTECYTAKVDTSKKEAMKHVRCLLRGSWKQLNEESLKSYVFEHGAHLSLPQPACAAKALVGLLRCN
ncbi:hypothetical protein V6N12_062676 [Hibiscus sabdariffa]|uniref:Uncharacterized protein n=1 Tax=Hibiscus sabdariffa TaxID=183260 RepID=A0ABR2F9L0_9ROSI